MHTGSGRWRCWHSVVLFLSLNVLGALSDDDDERQGSPVSKDGKYFEFATRQDIQAPVWKIARNNKTFVAPGFWFIAPYEEKTQEEPGGKFIGPHIYDSDGELIWSGTPMFEHWNVFDFTASNVNGKPHLAMQDWHGQRGVVLDSSYEIWKTAPMLGPGDTFQNMHAFHVVDDGKYALALNVRHWDAPNENSIADLGYNGTCKVSYQGFRELDLHAAGTPIVFDWHPTDHISLNESTYIKFGKDFDGTAAGMCKRGWDAMHVNAVDKFPDGDYLLSARHSDTLYKISHINGSVVWRLGGRTSDFEFVNNAKFARQHHGEVLEQNMTHIIISLFDNAAGEMFQQPIRRYSRGLILALDLQNRTATALVDYGHPRGQISTGRGSMQVLPNGNAFINWADDSHFSEHTQDGKDIVLEASLPAHVDTYRAFKFPWVGRPTQPPDVHVEVLWDDDHRMTTIVSMSWNGATHVDKWVVHGVGPDGKLAHVATLPRQGFETTLNHNGLVTNVYVEALDQHGTVLGTSKDGGQVWPERIPGWSKMGQNDTSKPGAGLVVFTVLVIVAVLAVGGLLFYRHRKRKAILQEAKYKGEYHQLGQDESIEDD